MEWLVPCNPAYYDASAAFNKLKNLNWKQSAPKIECNDIVYIYVSNPVRAVRFKCRVTNVNLPKREIDDSEFVLKGDKYSDYKRHMELELIRTFEDELTYEILAQNGVKGNIQCPRRVNPELHDYISQNDL